MKKLIRFKGQAIIFFVLMCLFLAQACKKDLLLQKDKSTEKNKQITNIGYQTFLNSIDINKTGSLKSVLAGSKEKIMATEKMATTLTLQTDSVKRLILHDTISYVLALKPQTPRAIQFQNITIQVANGKTTAFLSTYYPDKEWLDDWRKDKRMAFKGTITFNKINLDEIVAPPNNGVITSQNAGLKGKIIASIGNTDMMVTDRISLATGECEIYDVYSLVPYPCSTGDMPGHCIWETNDGLTMGDLDYLPGYRIDKNTVINCAMPQFPNSGNGGSGGGGNTTPNPPGSYDPCNGGPQPVQPGGIAFERGTRLMVAAPTACDPTPPSPNEPFVPTVTSRQFLLDNIDFSTIEFSYVNDPANSAAVNTLANYLLTNGLSLDNKLFIKWAVEYLMKNNDVNLNSFQTQFMPSTQIVADPNVDNWTDLDNEILNDQDQTVYQQYQDNQPWPTIDRVIDFKQFVPIRWITRPDGSKYTVNCLVLAKEQLGKAGYTCSGYLPGSQTFQTYKENTGVDLGETRKAISYIISSLTNKIPVLIGVDNRSGTPSTRNLDGSTDHFIVIVAMGTDSKGKYLLFMDSATNFISYGASFSNKLYFNSNTGKITGKTAIEDYRNQSGMHDYIVTQVRRSIKK